MKFRLVAGMAAALSIGGAALAADAVAVMRLEPEAADAVAALQAAKADPSPAGEAELMCGTRADGALQGCRLVGETPKGAHLGDAALALASNYRASAAGDVRVTVSFKALTRAKWTERPDGLLFMRALRKVGIQQPNGKAVLDCLVGLDGKLVSCRVLSSTPDANYGKAGMMVASNFRFRPATYGGQPVQSRVVIPLNFDRGWS